MDSTLQESMWHILSFEIVRKTKGVFLVWPLGVLFLAFQLSLFEFVLSLMVLLFFLQGRFLEPLAILA